MVKSVETNNVSMGKQFSNNTFRVKEDATAKPT